MMKTNSKLAYYFSTFPSISTTFLQREVFALTQDGQEVLTVANRRPGKGEVHPEDSGLLETTTYLTGLGPLRFVVYVLQGFAAHSSRVFPALLLALRLKDCFPMQRLVNIGHVCAAAALNTILRKNHVFHLHVHFALGAASVAIFHKALTGMPYSISIHGSDVLLPRPLTEEKLKQADMIISNCQFHVQNLTKKYKTLSPSKFKVIRLGLALNLPPWLPEPVSSLGEPLRILHVGRMVPVKAHEVLLEACRNLNDRHIPFECRLIGDGPCRRDLEQMVTGWGLQDRITYLGNQFSDAVAAAMVWSHVVVLCSKSEGTPMTLIEAMAKGRAVIAPDITALPEMVLSGKSGFLFEKGNVEQLTNYLARLAEDSLVLETLGREGRKIAEKHYDIRRCRTELIEAFAPYLSCSSAREQAQESHQ